MRLTKLVVRYAYSEEEKAEIIAKIGRQPSEIRKDDAIGLGCVDEEANDRWVLKFTVSLVDGMNARQIAALEAMAGEEPEFAEDVIALLEGSPVNADEAFERLVTEPTEEERKRLNTLGRIVSPTYGTPEEAAKRILNMRGVA